jgi:hypothetical protein
MRLKRSANLQINLCVAVVLTCRLLSAQHVHVMSTTGAGPARLPVLVDGSKNPEKIPDSLAYLHFFAAFAAHPTPTAQEQGRQNAQLGPLQLAAADRSVITTVLAGFRVQLDQIESAVALAGTPATLASLRAQKSAVAATTLVNLRQALTPDGASRVDRYVQMRVKSHIVIYGGSM